VRPRRHRDAHGSASIEAAVGIPAFSLFVGLIIFGGRTATTHEAVQSAAADAARSASIARSVLDARHQAEQAARDSLANQHIDCRSVTGVPGTRRIRATMASPLDTWRERA
jgi:Flp pilus assembly protein TadG